MYLLTGVGNWFMASQFSQSGESQASVPASSGTTAASSLLTLAEQRLGTQDLRLWAGAVSSTLQRQEVEKYSFVITSTQAAVSSGAFSIVGRDLSPEEEEGRAPWTRKKPKMASAAPSGEVRLGVLLPGRNLSYPWAWPRVQPALSLAQLRPPGLALRTAFASTEGRDGDCDHEVARWEAAHLKCSHDPDVLLGAGCGHPGYLVGRFAQHWQLPFLRAGAYGESSTALGSTVVYAGPGGPALLAFVPRLHRRFNWTSRAALVYAEQSNYRQYLFPSFMRLAADARTFDFHRYGQPEKAVRFIRAKGRVVHISGPLKMLQEIMHLAQAQNMTSGDYVFIYLDTWGESLRAEGHREAKKPWQSTESQDTGVLREAFQSVLVVTAHEPQTPEYRRFQSQLVQRAQRDFGVAVNDSRGTLVAGCFHDVLLLYLKALNETLQEGGTKQNTSRILEKMRGLKFQGVTGTVSLNRHNDREMDFDLWAMRDVESGEFQVVAQFVGTENQMNWLGPIHWKKGSPPLDNPPCVFDMDDPSCGKSGRVQGCGPASAEVTLSCPAPDARHPIAWFSRVCIDPPGMDAAPPSSLQEVSRHRVNPPLPKAHSPSSPKAAFPEAVEGGACPGDVDLHACEGSHLFSSNRGLVVEMVELAEMAKLPSLTKEKTSFYTFMDFLCEEQKR
ncbi:atrial natriuretic peptide receptor 2-like [Heteronotia binoei]|uniref:atrial natriuretic peptide receptor 2-like n=1 Tax=Heteronotia binoei TaxID=13085 RepID=UPI0029309786|nr:atrial natriuretic peptide receptor 2-like [Heteronotia binoei]